MINKLYWLPVVQLDIDRSSLNQHEQPGELVRLQIWSYLLETDHGPILSLTPVCRIRLSTIQIILKVHRLKGVSSPICIWIMPEAIRIFRIHRFMCSRPKRTLRSVIWSMRHRNV